MTDTLRRISRIRHLQENEARRDLAEAQAAEDQHVAATEALADRLQRLHDGPYLDADDLARRHAAALRLEMTRRRHARQASVLAQRTAQRQGLLREAAKEAAKAEKVVDSFAAAEAEERRLAQQARLDAIGARSWLRRREAA